MQNPFKTEKETDSSSSPFFMHHQVVHSIFTQFFSPSPPTSWCDTCQGAGDSCSFKVRTWSCILVTSILLHCQLLLLLLGFFKQCIKFYHSKQWFSAQALKKSCLTPLTANGPWWQRVGLLPQLNPKFNPKITDRTESKQNKFFWEMHCSSDLILILTWILWAVRDKLLGHLLHMRRQLLIL